MFSIETTMASWYRLYDEHAHDEIRCAAE